MKFIMKKLISCSLICILLLMLFTACTNEEANISPKGDVRSLPKIAQLNLLYSASGPVLFGKLEVVTSLESDIDKAKVYKIKNIDAEEKLKDLSDKFSIGNYTVEKDKDDVLSAQGENGTVMVSPLGGGYVFYAKQRNEDGELPSADEAKDIAIKYLKKLGIYEDSLQVSNVVERTLTDASGSAEITKRNIYFIRKPSGNFDPRTEVEWIRVQVGSKGNIDVVSVNQKELEEIGVYPIISKEEAIEKMRKGEGAIASDKSKADKAFVKEVRLTYFDNGPFSFINDTLQPVYIISGTLDKVDSQDHFTVQIRAIPDEYVVDGNQEHEKELPTNNKEFAFIKPDQIVNVVNGQESIISDNEVAGNILNSIETILTKGNGRISSYGDVSNIRYKVTKDENKSRFIKLIYNSPQRISLQAGENEKYGLQKSERDKFDNVAIPVNEILVFYDDTNLKKVSVLGDKVGLIIELKDDKAVKQLRNIVQ
ncbi:hypothetical protein Mahau_2956 [Mahella australiensis 50-1 BON]|uniref:Lipoprotein n=2 Tax=Mahella TaxID=252965 RepID=F4A0Z9_MAHA5|nr:hypothetical protein Mahau_2956 [Mahella australiensis 50-1 BON]